MDGLIRVQWMDERRCHDDDLSTLGSGEISQDQVSGMDPREDYKLSHEDRCYSLFFFFNDVSVFYLFDSCVTYVLLLA